MASADLRKELDCSICLSIYTDPVTLRCGHNFCRVCIDRVLDTQDGSGAYTCPDCRAECRERPALIQNIALCNIVRSFLSTRPDQEETRIFCTYCVDSPVPAAKSCLLCEASLCDKHLRVHSKSAEHVLCDPTTALGNRKCPVHKKVLEYYCTEDAACICVSCSLAGEHRGHLVELLDVASVKQKKKPRNVLQKLTTKREEAEKRVQSLQEHRINDQEKAAGLTETVTALFRDIRRQLNDLEKRVLREISRQEQRASFPVSDLIQQLEIKKDALSREMRRIEELCIVPDPVTVLQEPDKGDWCDAEDRERHDTQGCGVGELDVGHFSETLHKLYDIMSSINEGIYVQDSVDRLHDVRPAADTESEKALIVKPECNAESDVITGIKRGLYVHQPTAIILDINTAANNINIPQINYGYFPSRPIEPTCANWSDSLENRPETPERFQLYNQVLSATSFSSGRHYLDMTVSNAGWWSVGLCYPSIDRRGDQSHIGHNDKSWALCRRWYNRCSLIHDSKEICLSSFPGNSVGIYLDYEAGQLSFYDPSQQMRHIHTFTATFTEPLHVAICIGRGSTGISGRVSSYEK